MRISPEISDMLERSSPRKPDAIDTATIITRKLTATHIIAIFPLKRSLDAMNNDASISLQTISSKLQDVPQPEDGHHPNHT